MQESLYRKVKNRYVPVKEYDPELLDSWPEGIHLMVCVPGHKIIRYRINPDYAGFIEAFEAARPAIEKAILDGMNSPIQPKITRLTKAEINAWAQFEKVFKAKTISYGSVHDAVEAGLKALVEHAKGGRK